MTEKPVLVIGYGNSLRRDDGAGLILAAAIVDAWQERGLPVSLITDHQLSPELADDIANSGASIVLFVDATDATGSPSAAIEEAPIPALSSDGPSPSLGHQLTPAAVMVYAHELYRWSGAGWIISIPGFDFDHGEGLSESTRRLVDAYAGRAGELWSKAQAAGTQ